MSSQQPNVVDVFAHPPEFRIVGVAGKGAYAVVCKAIYDPPASSPSTEPTQPSDEPDTQAADAAPAVKPTATATSNGGADDDDAAPQKADRSTDSWMATTTSSMLHEGSTNATTQEMLISGSISNEVAPAQPISLAGPSICPIKAPAEVAIKRLVDFASCQRMVSESYRTYYLRKVCREIEILAHFASVDQIVNVNEVYLSIDQLDVFLVMPFISYDLEELLKTRTLQEDLIRWIVFQILLALDALHQCQVIHRDLTLKNVLVDGQTWDCRLADFGLSRARETYEEDLTLDVVTLEYRAPELLMQYKKYDSKVDIWSLGCIMAELFLRYRFFRPQRRDVFYQLRTIMDTLTGFPDMADVRAAASDSAISFMESTQVKGGNNLPQPKDIRQYFTTHVTHAAPSETPMSSPDTAGSQVPNFPTQTTTMCAVSDDGLAVLNSMLVWNPHKRKSAADLMQMPWFQNDPYCVEVLRARAEKPMQMGKFSEFVKKMDDDQLRSRIIQRAGNRVGTMETVLAQLPQAVAPQ